MYVFDIYILFCMHICIVHRFDLHFRSMRYITIDVIIIIQRAHQRNGDGYEWRRRPYRGRHPHDHSRPRVGPDGPRQCHPSH